MTQLAIAFGVFWLLCGVVGIIITSPAIYQDWKRDGEEWYWWVVAIFWLAQIGYLLLAGPVFLIALAQEPD